MQRPVLLGIQSKIAFDNLNLGLNLHISRVGQSAHDSTCLIEVEVARILLLYYRAQV